VFDSQGYVYVVPAVVDPNGTGSPYTVVAKLQLDRNAIPPYHVVQLFDSKSSGNDKDQNYLREVEVDRKGRLYVTQVHPLNENSFLWVYDTQTGNLIHSKKLVSPNNTLNVPSPIAMCISRDAKTLYFSSSLNNSNADSVFLYVLSTETWEYLTPIQIPGIGHITDITQDPVSGDLWIVGFKMPQVPSNVEDLSSQFYLPVLVRIPSDGSGPVCVPVSNHPSNTSPELGLPLSLLWVGGSSCTVADFDNNGKVDLLDFGHFAALAEQTG
jgi:hypothetical protein